MTNTHQPRAGIHLLILIVAVVIDLGGQAANIIEGLGDKISS
jgi:hypothetical protein